MPKLRETEETDALSDAENQEVTGSEALLQDVLEELSSSAAKLRIFKKGANKKFAYLVEYSPDEFSIQGIAEEYGGGDYQANILNEKGKYIRRIPFSIDAKIKGKIDRVPEITPQTNPMELIKPILDDAKAGSAELFKIMQKSSDDMFKMMMLMMQQSQQQTAAMVQMMVGLVQARPQSGDDIDKLVKMKMLFPDNTDKALEMFSRGMELGGNKTPEPWYATVLESLGPALLPILTGGKVQAPPPELVTLQDQPSETPKPDQKQMFALMQKAKELLAYVEQSAIFKKDTTEVANRLIAEARAINLLDKAAAFLQAPDWWTKLVAKNPAATAHEKYLKELRDKILSLLSASPPNVEVSTHI